LESRQLLAGDLVSHWLADDLSAIVADGQTVMQWTDRVGSQVATTVGAPKVMHGELSGRAVVRFDASDGNDMFRLPANNSPMSGAADYSISAVFRTDGTGLAAGGANWYEGTGIVDGTRLGFGKGWGVSMDAQGRISTGLESGFLAPVHTLTSTETGLANGQVQVVTVTRSGGELALYINGGPASTLSGADASPRDSIPLVIGGLESGANPFTGDIAEVRIYDGRLSAGEVAGLHAQLESFYHNQAPQAVADVYSLSEDPAPFGFASFSANVGVLANDTDAEGDAIVAELVTPTQHGNVSLNADGSFSYAPAKNFFGTDFFTYVARDGQASAVTTVTLNVSNTYDAATAVADQYQTLPTQTLNVSGLAGVLANDVNPDQVNLTAQVVGAVSQGSLTLNADGGFQFNPQGLAGTATFSYRVHDGTGHSAPATVTIIVNTPPTATDDTWTVNEDTTFVRTAANGLLANDQDPDGDALTVTVIDLPTQGTLAWQADGSFTYAPAADYFGPDQFTYRLNDGRDDSGLATVRLTVQAVNDSPVGSADSYYRPPGEVFDVGSDRGVLVNDTDIDSGTLTAVVAQQPAHGTLQLRADGSFIYTPNANFTGTDSFTYRASDGAAQSSPVQVNLLVGAPPVAISEIMAANATGLSTRVRTQPNGSFSGERETPDWIELVNLTSADLDLGGYHLTDDPDLTTKWQIPTGTIVPGGGHLVVYADGRDIRDPALDETGRLHTNFRFNVSGEYVAVVAPSGDVLDSVDDYPLQRADISYGRSASGQWGYLKTASPGVANANEQFAGLLPSLTVSVPRGFYRDAFPVTLAHETPSSVIRYTTDGSQPTATNGSIYGGPIAITTTTVLKAAAFLDNFLPSDVTAHSYIFPAAVLQQDNSGLEGAVRWGHVGPDWAMDPIIVNHENPEIRPVEDDLLRIPTVSLSIDTSLMFGSSGIYIRGENIERPVAFEYIDPAAGDNGIQTNSTVQIVGGSSPQRWKSDKLSMRVRFTEDAGESELAYPLFGPGAARSFDTLVVDARLNNVWHYGGGSSPQTQRNIAQYMRDEFAADLQRAAGGTATHGQHVHVYLNGQYWGIHTLHERPDENFAAHYLGGDSLEYDVIKHNVNDVVNGSNDSYRELAATLAGSGTLSDENYAKAAELLHVDDFIDYMLVNFYGGNQDWDHQNWYASRNRVDGQWRFHSWDAEKVLQGVRDDSTSINNANSPTAFHRRLSTHPEYALKFQDAVREHFFHDGAMTPDAAAALYKWRSDQIDPVMRVESARWGDNQIDNGARKRYTRLDWVATRDGFMTTYFPQRTDIVLGQFTRRGWWDGNRVVDFQVNGTTQYGGVITPGSQLTMSSTAAGTYYFTQDGSDPRLAGGDVSPGAVAYSSSVPLPQTTHIMARLLQADGSWGPLSHATFSTAVPADATNLRIAELNYHPSDTTPAEEAAGFTDADEFEFIELLNIGNQRIDLSNVRFEQTVNGSDVQGLQFDFATSTIRELGPGERLVVVENWEAFERRYGSGLPVAGVWSGGLSNAQERLVLKAGDQVIGDFVYLDDWHPTTDGEGYSLQAVNETGSPDNWGTAAAWKPSSRLGGSPGTADSSGPIPGDSNGDGIFNSSDLVAVFQAGKYEDLIAGNATFAEGDWNGDGDFTTADLVYAFQQGTYVAGAVPVAFESMFSAWNEPNRRKPRAVDAAFAEFDAI
jgi:VCBS repeat-containing protein